MSAAIAQPPNRDTQDVRFLVGRSEFNVDIYRGIEWQSVGSTVSVEHLGTVDVKVFEKCGKFNSFLVYIFGKSI
ncbi:hypothetical protein TNCV_2131591 [Trichonephila clavipes]|nr:hypothetical protein TNCV_2131591 [Trichonephila clavipes]